ncbi:hypothetical protein LRH25_16625 [Ideonella azotifigens]|uniref:DUF465 domain-containing protein n=1 Tax=Ideonella azotifigens TaxID=513160 RepID=A0ABN1JJD0_9BURK|nr:hypothetical protein [Ideonella azotifigens]MCD2341967.1 hypothetical protein [Ideonella azotifigens]
MTNRFDVLDAIEQGILAVEAHILRLEDAKAANGGLDPLSMHKLLDLRESLQIFQARRLQLLEAAQREHAK